MKNIFKRLKNDFHGEISSFFGDSYLENNYKKIGNDIHSISQFLPYKFYDEKTQIFINQNTVGFALQIGSFFGSDPRDMEVISNLLRDNIPEGSDMQIINYASPRVGNLLEDFVDSRKNVKDQIKVLARKRAEFVSKANWHDFANKNSSYRIRNFKTYLFFSSKIKNQNLDFMDKIINFSEKGSSSIENIIDKKQRELLIIRENFINLLNSIGLGGKIVKANEFISFVDEILNANSLDTLESNKIYNPLELISNQIPDIENKIEVGEEGVSLYSDQPLKNVIAKCFSFKQYPLSFSQGHGINLIGDYNNDLGQIPCAFLQTIFIHFPHNAEKEKMKIKVKSVKYQKNRENPLFRFFPGISEKADEYNFVSKKLDDGQKIVEIWNQVMLLAPPNQIEVASRNLINLYTRAGFTLVVDRYLSLQSFLAFLPFNLSDSLFDDMKFIKRTDKVLSWTVANLAPLQGEPKGNILNPCMLLFGRRGQPFFFHPFASTAGGNFNTCIVGKSGSGKSFFMQDYMMSIAGMGGRMIIIDDGQSFQKTCFYLDGKYIEFTEGNNICLNPFTFLKQESELSVSKDLNETEEETQGKNSFYDEVVNFIVKLIRSMIVKEDEACSKVEGEIISLAVNEAIERKGFQADLKLVSNILVEWYQDKTLDRPQSVYDLMFTIPLRMKSFTEGEYSRYFVGEANITIDSDFVVFELSHIKDKPDLQRAVTLYASFLGFKEMYLGDRKQIKSFVVDEAWALLAGKEMSDFMEAMARRARKYNGQLVIATQSIEDFYKSPATEAIMNNSDYLCIMSQKAESITALEKSGKLGDMSSHLKSTLLSVKTEKGKYSESLIYAHGNYTVTRLIVDPFAVKLYSSDAKDFKQIEDLMQKGYSLVESLEIAVDGGKKI